MIIEKQRETRVEDDYDVIVCGAGPAGICAAIAAARGGARTCLLEAQGCLGGVWTSGLLSLILDSQGKAGILEEIRAHLEVRSGSASHPWLYDAEEMKLILEEMATEAGVDWLLHTRVVHVCKKGRRLTHVIVENKSGRSALAGSVFIDSSGDGDLAALAGCHFEFGDPVSGLGQPMTMMALIHGVPESVKEAGPTKSTYLPKARFREILLGVGHSPSYSEPSLFPLPNGCFCLMIHHAYEFSGLNARDLTEATREGRSEVMRAVRRLRENAAGWEQVRVLATGNHVGVREGRRIRGLYQITKEDVTEGLRVEDKVCRVSFPVDVHALRREDGGGYGSGGLSSKPYDIPFRSLVAKDCDGLLLAGRCISGDFYAHASYRVTGNAAETGEAAGKAAAFCARENSIPAEVTWCEGAPKKMQSALCASTKFFHDVEDS